MSEKRDPSTFKLSFGAHKGKTLDQVPADYLIWIGEQKWIEKFPTIVEYVNKHYRLLLEEDGLDPDELEGL